MEKYKTEATLSITLAKTSKIEASKRTARLVR
jgi:hypothetical protein